MTEVYKIVTGIATPMMNSLFQFRYNAHNIRYFQDIFRENAKTVKFAETVMYQASSLWANLHTKCKNANSLNKLKSNIKAWKCDFCFVRYAKNTCKT